MAPRPGGYQDLGHGHADGHKDSELDRRPPALHSSFTVSSQVPTLFLSQPLLMSRVHLS